MRLVWNGPTAAVSYQGRFLGFLTRDEVRSMMRRLIAAHLAGPVLPPLIELEPDPNFF